jgi:hypothetical protein
VAADCWTRRCGSVRMAELFWKPRKMTRWPLGHWGLKCRHYMTTPWHAWAGQWCRETVEMQKRRGWVLKLFYRKYRNSVDLFYFHILYTCLIDDWWWLRAFATNPITGNESGDDAQSAPEISRGGWCNSSVTV